MVLLLVFLIFLLSMRSSSSVLLLLFVGSRVSIRLFKTTPRLCRVCKTPLTQPHLDVQKGDTNRLTKTKNLASY